MEFVRDVSFVLSEGVGRKAQRKPQALEKKLEMTEIKHFYHKTPHLYSLNVLHCSLKTEGKYQ